MLLTPMATDLPLIEVSDLRVAFGHSRNAPEVLRGVSLSIRPGETLCLVGESGSGKSLTARAILQLIDRPGRVTGGRILWRPERGEPLDLVAPNTANQAMQRVRGREISMIFQEPMAALSPVHTIGDQLTEGLRLHMGLGKSAARQRAIELLDRVGIPRPEVRLDQYAFQFSGGMRQRAMIAIALACRPRLLIADEPTTALDVTTQAQVLSLLADLQRELGMAILFITHDLGVVAEIADRVAVMYAGQIVERAPVTELFARPSHPYTRALLAAVPRPDTVAGSRLSGLDGTVPSSLDLPRGCAFAPRCPARQDGLCDVASPTAIDVVSGHSVSCLRVAEVAHD